MRVLGLDTATWMASVGIVEDLECVAERSREASPSHGLSLLPLIQETLAAAGLLPNQLEGLAVSIGPGSFTGLRIGLSTAKGFALACGLRLVGIPTLGALAVAARVENGFVCPVLDARKGQVYTALFRVVGSEMQKVVPECAVDLTSWLARIPGPCTFIGDGVDLVRRESSGRFARDILSFERHHPLGSIVAAIGARRLAAGDDDDIATLEPMYVRPSEAELNCR